MTNTITTAVDQAPVNEDVASNPLTNIWLVILAVCLGVTLLGTLILVAWPIVAQLAAG